MLLFMLGNDDGVFYLIVRLKSNRYKMLGQLACHKISQANTAFV